MDELAVVSLQAVTQIPQIMTSTLQIAPELRQTVISDKINEAIANAIELVQAKIYDQALIRYEQILNNVALLSNREQQSYLISHLIHHNDIAYLLEPLTQLPYQEQNKWIDWLLKVQQSALNFNDNPFTIAQNLKRLAKLYQTLGRNELVAIALQQVTAAVQQISEPMVRAEQLIDLASMRLEFQQKAETQQVITQALAVVEQIPNDGYAPGNYLFSIASLYIKLGELRRAAALADKFDHEYFPNTIRQEVVRDAIKREDLHLAYTVTAKISAAEYQAIALVEMAVYWATHHQPRLGNRLFAQALKRVAKEQFAEDIQSRLIQTYSTSGQLSIALNAAQRLTQDAPKVIALSAIAVAYAKAKQQKQVQQVIAQLANLIQGQNTLMSTALYAQEYNLAIAVFNRIKNNGDFVYTSGLYRQLVYALQLQDIDKALAIAKQAPNNWLDERSYNLKEVAIAYANAQKWSQAIEVVKQIDNTLSTPHQVLTRLELAAKAPTPEEFISLINPAIAQAQALEPIASKALALAAIARVYMQTGDAQQTQSFLQQTIQTVQQLTDDESRSSLFMQITYYLIEQSQYSAALTIAQANPIPDWRQSAFDIIFYQACTFSAFDVAFQILELESLPDKQATLLLGIASTYAKQQRKKDAIALLDRAFAVAQQIADPESRIIHLDQYTQVADPNDRRSQYTLLVKQYVALERLDKAQQVVEKVQETSLRDYLQAWIDC